MIYKKTYKICYSYKNKGAVYVSYELDGKLVNKKNISKRFGFYTEKELEEKYQSKKQDYYGTPYDRGHLANDASFDYDIDVLKSVYSMANIVPQYSKTNRYTWIKTERLERKLAVKYNKVQVFIGILYNKNSKKIGNGVSVPYAYYKKISNGSDYQQCFYFSNKIKSIKKDKLAQHSIDCNSQALDLGSLQS